VESIGCLVAAKPGPLFPVLIPDLMPLSPAEVQLALYYLQLSLADARDNPCRDLLRSLHETYREDLTLLFEKVSRERSSTASPLHSARDSVSTRRDADT